MRALHRTGIVVLSAVFAVAGGVLSATAASAGAQGGGGDHHRGRTVYVSPSGDHANSGRSCSRARYATVQAGVDAARTGDTVVVCAGTYAEDVVVAKSLTLRGRHATIKGTSTANGMCDQIGPTGPGSAPCLAAVTIKSSHVTVSGFTVKGAIGEGILATGSVKGGSIRKVSDHRQHRRGQRHGWRPAVATPRIPSARVRRGSGRLR